VTAYDEGLAALREAQGPLPVRSRGVIALLEENCTSCMVCARECPDWCIEIDSHKETLPPRTERGRPRVLHVLDRFAIDYSLCMWCGICVEACPFDALFWAPEVPDAAVGVQELVHERPQLRDWLAGVPNPPALDPAAESAKEVQDAQKRARPAP
jgi:NADH-quinone oxidoreductase subunit I